MKLILTQKLMLDPPSGSSRAFRYQLGADKLPAISPWPISQAVAPWAHQNPTPKPIPPCYR